MNDQLNIPSTIRVLIADPDEALLARYRELMPEDFNVLTAATGRECIARLREQTPDVLVLEPQLPSGGGELVLAVMRAIPVLAKVPVMILTSCRDPAVLGSVASFLVRDYRVKPLKPDRLATWVRTVVDRHRNKTLRSASPC